MLDNRFGIHIGIQKPLMNPTIPTISLFLQFHLIKPEILNPVLNTLSSPEGQNYSLFNGIIGGQGLQVGMVVVAESEQIGKRVRFTEETVPVVKRLEGAVG